MQVAPQILTPLALMISPFDCGTFGLAARNAPPPPMRRGLTMWNKCQRCKGNGKCTTCDGSGSRGVWKCDSCRGSGDCKACDGRG